MEQRYLSIGKMAKMNRVTIPTLRLYDELNLLKPRYVDPESGYRYYDIHQNARLDMIIYMKELGMNLSEISAVLEKGDIFLIEQILMEKNEQLHAQIRELKLRHNAVERAIDSIERYRKAPAPGTISLEYIDRRFILGIPCEDNFYESDIRSYEKMLTELRGALKNEAVINIHTYNVGTSIKREDFINGSFVADQIFAFIDKQIKEIINPPGLVHILDSGIYACIYLARYENEIDYAKRLLNFCAQNDYCIVGDYICEVMTEFNVFNSNERNMFLRLQIPVKVDKKTG